MAKLTVADLKTLVDTYVNANLMQIPSASYTPDFHTISNHLLKIGEMIMLDSDFSDRLPELDSRELEYGTTIEEYFMDFVLPVNYDGDGTTDLAPKRPTFQDTTYTKELGRKTIPITIDDTKYKNGMLGAAEYAQFLAWILKRHQDSQNLYKYALKRQLLGRFIEKLSGSPQVETTAKPTDTATAEAWIKKVKEEITNMRDFIKEDYNLYGVPAKSPELVLYIAGADTIPVLDVDALAGAFNKDKVEIPVVVKQLEDFGEVSVNKNAWAFLLDPRGAALKPHSINVTETRNGQGEFRTFYWHATYTAFISKATNAKVWVSAAD